jgi:hypothetical protein
MRLPLRVYRFGFAPPQPNFKGRVAKQRGPSVFGCSADLNPDLPGAKSPNQYAAVTPPSMRTSLPVMKAPSGPMSRAPTVPTSSGVPARPAAEISIIRR